MLTVQEHHTVCRALSVSCVVESSVSFDRITPRRAGLAAAAPVAAPAAAAATAAIIVTTQVCAGLGRTRVTLPLPSPASLV